MRIILGIDPGTVILGYAIIGVERNHISILSMGILKLNKLASHELRLKHIFDRVHGLVKEYKPDELAIEAPFYGKNVQSMLKLGRAQGVAMAAALHHEIPIIEYSPRKIKQSITGKGNASKEQVAAMLQSIMNVDLATETLDATDALAVAVCHHNQGDYKAGSDKKYGSWKSFLSDNPDRIG